MTTETIFVQQWVEHERGWGQRPDGCSVHHTLEDLKAFVAGYNAEFNNRSIVPDEYNQVDGDPVEMDLYPTLNEKDEDRLHEATVNTAGWRSKGIFISQNLKAVTTTVYHLV